MTNMVNRSGFYMDLMRAVDALITHVRNLPDNPSPQKSGGYLTLIHVPTGTVALQASLGTIDLDKKDKYREISLEKALRLLQNPDHVSSFQTRDPDNGKWGGAIRTEMWIISFSGLPEKLDEAACTAAAFKLRQLKMDEVESIALTSSNPFTDLLMDIIVREKTNRGQVDY